MHKPLVELDLHYNDMLEIAKGVENDLKEEETEEKKRAVMAQLSNSNEDTARNDGDTSSPINRENS